MPERECPMSRDTFQCINEVKKIKPKMLFWKGKQVSEKVYSKRHQSQEWAKTIRSVYGTRSKIQHNLKNCVNTKCVEVEG